jgi:hypothetical protein
MSTSLTDAATRNPAARNLGQPCVEHPLKAIDALRYWQRAIDVPLPNCIDLAVPERLSRAVLSLPTAS